MDGVYFENQYGKLVFKEIKPDDEDVALLAKKMKIRINRALKKRCLLDEYSPAHDEQQLELLKAESVQNLVDGNKKPFALGKWGSGYYEEFYGSKCAAIEGFSLHANVKILASQRSALEKLCRYINRGAIAKDRILLDEDGDVSLKLKTQYNDGTAHLVFTPGQFIKRVIALIPPPRLNIIRYYGLFGARHRNRKEITSKARPKKDKSKKRKVYRTPWAELLKRVFKVDVTYCDNCGTKLELIATITSLTVCRKILNHLKLDSEKVVPSSPRDPPEVYQSDILDDFDNQEYNW